LTAVLAVMLSAAKHLCAPRADPSLRSGWHPRAADRPCAAWRRDKQPVRGLDRCPGGTVEHAYLQMSTVLQSFLHMVSLLTCLPNDDSKSGMMISRMMW